MAGSYRHCNDRGKFDFKLIENLGDAFEACEQMYWMIDYLAGGDRKKIKEAENAWYNPRPEQDREED